MKTLAKVFLIVFWLLGAGTGGMTPDASPAHETSAYRMALVDGVDLHVHDQRVTVQIDTKWTGRMTMSAAVPGWVAALSSHLHAASSTGSTTAASLMPSPARTTSHGT